MTQVVSLKLGVSFHIVGWNEYPFAITDCWEDILSILHIFLFYCFLMTTMEQLNLKAFFFKIKHKFYWEK